MTTPAIPSPEAQLEVIERGTVDINVREELVERLKKSHATQSPLHIKTGFDPTAPDIHLGHTVLIEKMRQLQELGHQITFIVGDYTALIGDPTGRNTLRPALSPDQVKANAETYQAQAEKILDPQRTRFEWNSSWLSKLDFGEIIKLASHYNLGRMLERRDFKERFESGTQIALHEFLYPLMQGYDSVVLKPDLELGGTEQIFNLNVGRHLMAAYGQQRQICVTVPLLVGLDGTDKMSKSKGNHIGISEPADDIFGKTMSISDDTAKLWFPLLMAREIQADDPLDEKKTLAHGLVKRFHGDSAANETLSWWNAGRPPRNVPEHTISPGSLAGMLVDVGFAASNSDARRKIKQGGVSLDGSRVESVHLDVSTGSYLLKVGKKNIARLTVTG